MQLSPTELATLQQRAFFDVLLRVVARAVYGAPLTTAEDERNFSKLNKLLSEQATAMHSLQS